MFLSTKPLDPPPTHPLPCRAVFRASSSYLQLPLPPPSPLPLFQTLYSLLLPLPTPLYPPYQTPYALLHSPRALVRVSECTWESRECTWEWGRTWESAGCNMVFHLLRKQGLSAAAGRGGDRRVQPCRAS
eukprot:356071-Rhodomonas_salina.1